VLQEQVQVPPVPLVQVLPEPEQAQVLLGFLQLPHYSFQLVLAREQ
jgi:hypothetical protein